MSSFGFTFNAAQQAQIVLGLKERIKYLASIFDKEDSFFKESLAEMGECVAILRYIEPHNNPHLKKVGFYKEGNK